MGQPVAKLAEARGNAMALTGHHDLIVAFGIEPFKGHRVLQTQTREQSMNRLAFSATKNVVDLCTEAVLAHLKGMRVSARGVVRLQNRNPPAGRNQQRRNRKARHSRANNEVVKMRRIAHCPERLLPSNQGIVNGRQGW